MGVNRYTELETQKDRRIYDPQFVPIEYVPFATTELKEYLKKEEDKKAALKNSMGGIFTALSTFNARPEDEIAKNIMVDHYYAGMGEIADRIAKDGWSPTVAAMISRKVMEIKMDENLKTIHNNYNTYLEQTEINKKEVEKGNAKYNDVTIADKYTGFLTPEGTPNRQAAKPWPQRIDWQKETAEITKNMAVMGSEGYELIGDYIKTSGTKTVSAERVSEMMTKWYEVDGGGLVRENLRNNALYNVAKSVSNFHQLPKLSKDALVKAEEIRMFKLSIEQSLLRDVFTQSTAGITGNSMPMQREKAKAVEDAMQLFTTELGIGPGSRNDPFFSLSQKTIGDIWGSEATTKGIAVTAGKVFLGEVSPTEVNMRKQLMGEYDNPKTTPARREEVTKLILDLDKDDKGVAKGVDLTGVQGARFYPTVLGKGYKSGAPGDRTNQVPGTWVIPAKKGWFKNDPILNKILASVDEENIKYTTIKDPITNVEQDVVRVTGYMPYHPNVANLAQVTETIFGKDAVPGGVNAGVAIINQAAEVEKIAHNIIKYQNYLIKMVKSVNPGNTTIVKDIRSVKDPQELYKLGVTITNSLNTGRK